MRTKEECLDVIIHRYTDMAEMRKACQSMSRMGYSKRIVATNQNSVQVKFTRELS